MGAMKGMLGENGLAALPIGQRASDPASRGVGRPDVRKLAGGGLRFRCRYTKANGQRDRVAAAPRGRAHLRGEIATAAAAVGLAREQANCYRGTEWPFCHSCARLPRKGICRFTSTDA